MPGQQIKAALAAGKCETFLTRPGARFLTDFQADGWVIIYLAISGKSIHLNRQTVQETVLAILSNLGPSVWYVLQSRTLI